MESKAATIYLYFHYQLPRQRVMVIRNIRRGSLPKAFHGTEPFTFLVLPSPNNKVLERFSSEERKNIGVHTCPVSAMDPSSKFWLWGNIDGVQGGDNDSVHSADVPYAKLLPSLFQINAGYVQRMSSFK